MKLITIPTAMGSMGKCNTEGPEEILNSLKQLYLNEDGKETHFDIVPVSCPQDNLEETNKNISETIKKITERFIALGGDHSITYPIVKAVQENSRAFGLSDAGIVIFDAHADVMDNFAPPTHEDYLRVLIEEGIVNPAQVILIGLRNIDVQEMSYLKEKNIRYFTMKQLFEEGTEHIADTITETINSWKGGFYLSIDIDAIDPAYAPGTGYCEPGGLSSREFLYILSRIKRCKGMVASDLVEINSAKDEGNKTCFLGAKILKELY